MAGAGAAVGAFAVAASTIVALMFTLSLLVATAQDAVTLLVDRGAVLVRQWTGVALVLIGAWLLVLAGWADLFARVFPV